MCIWITETRPVHSCQTLVVDARTDGAYLKEKS